jgi:hypothetical protein
MVVAEPEESTEFDPRDYFGTTRKTAVERREHRLLQGEFTAGPRLFPGTLDAKLEHFEKTRRWWAALRRLHRAGLGPLPGMVPPRPDLSARFTVSNTPALRPSLLVTTIPPVPWTRDDVSAWLSHGGDLQLLTSATPDEADGSVCWWRGRRAP